MTHMTKTAPQPSPPSGKTRGYAYDVDAWVQFHLLRLASFHAETTKADLAVLAEIIQRYWGKYGNGWITHEKLGAMAGVSKATVIRAKRNLERLGFVTIVQAGRRGSATVYQPNFGLVSAKGSKDDTETLGVTDATETDAIGSIGATETTEYGVTDDTPSYLQDRPTRAGSQIDRIECATPTAPLADGLGATAARTAQGDGFDRLWKAYSHRQRKADARAAFDKLAPKPELIEQMIVSAGAWFSAWSAQYKPDAPRFTLARWIEREEYECDPPTAYKAKERKPKVAQPKPLAKKPASSAKIMAGAINRSSPVGTFRAEIVGSKVIEDTPGEHLAQIEINWSGTSGDEWPVDTWHEFLLKSQNAPAAARGMAMLASIMQAVGFDDPTLNDTEELHFRPFLCTIHEDLTITYAPLPANDNHAEVAA